MAIRKDLSRFCRRAVELGAKDAKVISAANVFTAPWVRLKCQYGCGGYGGRLTCPPHSPTPSETRAVLECYEYAVLIRGDAHTDVRTIAVKLEREVFLSGYYKAFAYGCGPCNLCTECSVEEGCNHPDLARPAMEAAGMDVFATARAAGLPIEVVTQHDQCQNYYALVLIE